MENSNKKPERKKKASEFWNKPLRFRLTILIVLVSLFWGIAVILTVGYIYRSNAYLAWFAIIVILFISFTVNMLTIHRLVITPVRLLVKGVTDYQPGAEHSAIFSGSGLNPSSEFIVLESAILDLESRILTMLAEVKKAEELTTLMLDSNPLCCQIWSSDLRILDCSKATLKLFGISSKQEFIERISEFSPEFQPDGLSSKDKTRQLLNEAFREGRCDSSWLHRRNDGKTFPAEVTLVRVRYMDGDVVAVYTRDLSDIVSMEDTIYWLKKEVDKIYYDALTGIYNRRYFDENLNRLLKLISRSGGMLSLLMVDIDHFKMYNDTFGHSEGDKCLKIVAETLSGNMMRGEDFVARYGGEEFVVVLPYTDENGVRLIADKLIKSILDLKIVHEKNQPARFVTVSIGATTGEVHFRQKVDDYVRRADELLYRSKQQGRNRYTFEKL